MEFNLDKVPVKYILGTYIDEQGYPSPTDILYLMTKRAADRGKPLSPVSFTTTVLLKKVGDKHAERIMQSLNELSQKSVIEKTRETKTGVSYRILKNPFI